MKAKFGKKQSAKNLIMNIAAFIIQFIISFYISPVIVSKTGASAYGFIGLATDFVSYAAIITTVFNSVASRFIAKSVYEDNYEKANNYFNSLIVANIYISGLLGIIIAVLIPNLDRILSIPPNLIVDVKITFFLILGSYILSVLTMVFSTSTFITNRTDMQGVRNIIQYLLRFVIIFFFLNFVSVKIYWVALGTLVATIFVAIMNISLNKKLTPYLKINLKLADNKYVIELARSGCWMALTSISTMLLRGLDLTVANVMIGDYEMGLLSIARAMPNNITSIIATITPIFTPALLVYFTKNNISALNNNLRLSISTMAIILFVPITGFIVYSYDFYSLWQNSLSEKELTIVTWLSILTIVQAYFNSTTSSLAQISVVVNKLRMPVLVSFATGILSFLAEIILIKFTHLGLYAIVLSTTIIIIIRYVIFNSLYAARCLNTDAKIYFIHLVKVWASIPLLIFIMYFVKKMIPAHTWMNLLFSAFTSAIIGYVIMVFLYARKEFLNVYDSFKRRMGLNK